MKKNLLSLFTLLLLSSALMAQVTEERTAYVKQYKDIAIRKMVEYGIPASITLAQGVLESGAGKSELALKANNHFGIKCHKEWTGKKFYYDDDEPNECFRKYDSAEESYDDHSFFLITRERYNDLFDLDVTDYRGWAFGLKKAGYATNPNYPKLLIKIIEEYKLYNYDMVALGLLTENEADENAAIEEKLSTGLNIEDYDNIDNKILADSGASVDGEDASADRKDQEEKVPEEKANKKREKREKAEKAVSTEDNNREEKQETVTPVYFSMGEVKCKGKATYQETYLGKDIYSYNGVPAVFVSDGETIEQIADMLKINLGYLRHYNDLPKGAVVSTGDIIYIGFKKVKSEYDIHTVRSKGETLWSISQYYTLKVSKLMKKNKISDINIPLEGGTIIKLM